MQEVRQLDVEGDRRRFSMLVQGVLDPEHYLAALADFLLCISETMVEDVRPPQGNNGRQGKVIRFEEGCLCQQRTPYPGTDAKLSTGRDGGWFAGITAVIRRLLLTQEHLNIDAAVVMQRCTINFTNVDNERANVILRALKEYEATLLRKVFTLIL